ncbi:MAG: hypothetical protein GY777_22270 [Candidatus Brocadiaceae bacterium]|nr:hypothetical protein [Candidatus Brocadiaceae bacterium]
MNKWFYKNLKKPDSFSKSNKPNAHHHAISWYKDAAKEHIAKMYELPGMLEAHDVHVTVIRTERPGYIVYEDNFQVAAIAVKETGA